MKTLFTKEVSKTIVNDTTGKCLSTETVTIKIFGAEVYKETTKTESSTKINQ